MKKIILSFICALSLNGNAHNFQFLEQITNLTAPSGFEEPVAKVIESNWQPHLKNLHKDGMGNVIGYSGQSGKNRVLLMSHMDEVGFLISHIDKQGMVRLQPLGGINDNVVTGQRYTIQTEKGPVTAYSGLEAIHIIPKDKRDQLITKEQLFLDIGASSKKEAMEKYGVYPGQAVTFAGQFSQIGQYRFLAKALDDRVGLSLLNDVIKAKVNTNNLIVYAATVQEEVGLRGAKVIYDDIKPDVVFNIEIGIANDFPLRVGKKYSDISLNKGPTLFIYDASMIPNQKLIQWIKHIAKREKINLQLEVEPGYGEDGASVQTKGHGIASVNLGIPIRYAHQQLGVFDSRDYQQALKLIKILVSEFDKSVL